jgi:peptide/nickel transport system substrate-binding protein
VSYKNSEADALILQIRAEFDREKRNVLSRKLNQIVIDDAPYVFLYHMPKRTLLHRKVKGAYDSPIESFQFREMWMDPTWKSAHASR